MAQYQLPLAVGRRYADYLLSRLYEIILKEIAIQFPNSVPYAVVSHPCAMMTVLGDLSHVEHFVFKLYKDIYTLYRRES